jgi:hypothetical protein
MEAFLTRVLDVPKIASTIGVGTTLAATGIQLYLCRRQGCI